MTASAGAPMPEALVLAGGFGTRLRTVVADLPKPMAPVAGRPFLEFVLGGLARHGVPRAVLSVGYLSDIIIGHFGHVFQGMALDYAVEATPLGTGGAVAEGLRHCAGPAVLVLNGDTWLDLELHALVGHWQREQAPVIVAREVDDVARYGSLQVEDGRVVRFVEKGPAGPGLINAGVYLLPRDLFAAGAPAAPFSLEADVLAPCVRSRRVDAFITRGEFIDIGIPDDYHRAQRMRLGQPAT